MKKINLTRGKFALVDDEDYDYLNQYKWYASTKRNRKYWYAVRSSNRINGKQTRIWMHRIIMNALDDIHIDHIDGNGLNNQKSNLRFASSSQNNQNRHARWGLSKYKGVALHKKTKKWQAQIHVYGIIIYLGLFKSERLAAVTYNIAALLYYGEYANLNDI